MYVDYLDCCMWTEGAATVRYLPDSFGQLEIGGDLLLDGATVVLCLHHSQCALLWLPTSAAAVVLSLLSVCMLLP